jgi:hypothetical protein
MRPDWVTIVLGSKDPNAQVGRPRRRGVGYVYHPGGRNSGRDPVGLLREEVAHFAPIPDPSASFRGMSWLTPVIREILADGAATTHKLKFFENGATPNMIVSSTRTRGSAAGVRAVQGDVRGEPQGVDNAYETLFLGGGADATVVGSDMRQLDFKVTQGAGETRIAAAAGVPPVIVGLSEGLQAATYSNYSQARRRFADGTMRPLWRNIAGSLATIVEVPAGRRALVRRPRHPVPSGGPEGRGRGQQTAGDRDPHADRRRLRARLGHRRGDGRRLHPAQHTGMFSASSSNPPANGCRARAPAPSCQQRQRQRERPALPASSN